VVTEQTDRQTDTQNDYCNPTAHAPRDSYFLNYWHYSTDFYLHVQTWMN